MTLGQSVSPDLTCSCGAELRIGSTGLAAREAECRAFHDAHHVCRAGRGRLIGVTEVALRALEELRRVTGVDEWDEADWRTLAYCEAWELLGEGRAYEVIGEVRPDSFVPTDDVTEALDAIDKHAEKGMDHDLHATVEHYRRALNV